MTRNDFQTLTQNKTVLLDGGTGSVLRTLGMPVGVSTEKWILEHPDVLIRLQSDYADAGAQIVYAPTFMSNRLGLEMHGLQDDLVSINKRLVALTREAVGTRALVAGDMTTTGQTLEPLGTMRYDTLMDIYREQALALRDAGADLIVAETMLTAEECLALLEAVQGACDLPVMCTLTVQADGSLLYGGRIEDALEMLQTLGAAAVGINCSVGPDQMMSTVRCMKAVCDVPLIVKLNAGLPVMDKYGMAHYSMNSDDFAAHMRDIVAAGADIVGGCCGTDPKYIRKLAQVLRG